MNSLESTLQKLSDDELIRMVYIVPDDYTVEGIECAKSILESRGAKPDKAVLKHKISEVFVNEITEILKPKELNPIQEMFSLERIVWFVRVFPAYFLWTSRGELAELFSTKSYIISWAVWAIVLSGLEWCLRKKKLKDIKMNEDAIRKLKGKVEA